MQSSTRPKVAVVDPATPANALKPDSSGNIGINNFPATQPVSGTVTANQGSAGASAWPVSQADGAHVSFGAEADAAAGTDTASATFMGLFKRLLQRITTLLAVFPTTIDINSGNKSASTLRVVLATDQPALTNKLLVTPDSVALPSHQSTNVDQLNGTTADTNSGNKSAGTLRVVIATDQPALTNGLPAAAALADGASNPITPMDGACLLVFNGATWDRLRAANVHKDLSALAIGTITTGWTPASGKKVRLMGGSLSVSAASSILFEDNTGGTTVWRTPKLAADTPFNFDLGQGVLLSAANNVLKLTSSASANVTGTLYGIEE